MANVFSSAPIKDNTRHQICLSIVFLLLRGQRVHRLLKVLSLQVITGKLCLCAGESRALQVEGAAFERAAELLRRSPEFTVLAALRQDPANSGTILSFSHGYNR